MSEHKEAYNGWTNRETWAVKLHWDNNEGDYEHFTNEARNFKKSKKDLHKFADFLEETAEKIKETVFDGGGSKDAINFMSDVGSLWRVDWQEIAKAYYEEIEETISEVKTK